MQFFTDLVLQLNDIVKHCHGQLCTVVVANVMIKLVFVALFLFHGIARKK